MPDIAPQRPSLLRDQHSGFLPFLVARVFAVGATQIQAVVVAWQVYDLTRNPMALAFVGLAQFIPMLLLLLPAGELIDRLPRKKVLAASWAIGGVCSALLWWLSGHGHAGVAGIYAVLVLYGATRAFSGPSLQSLLPQLVPMELLPQAIATNSVVMRCAAIGAPMLGGFLYAAGGAEWTYGVCMLAFAIGTLLLLRVKVLYAAPKSAAQRNEAGDSIWQRFGTGIRFIFSRPMVLGTISLDLFAVLLGGVVALLPIYAHEVLHTGPEGLGLLRSSMAIGEVCAGLYLSNRPFDARVGQRMMLAVGVFGIANLVFSLSHWLWLSCLALAVAGAADMVSVYVRGALLQFATPDNMRGRVNAVNMLFIGSSNELGEFRAGSSASLMGAVPAAIAGGICTLAVVGLWTRIFPSLWQVNRFEDAQYQSQAGGPSTGN
ncbi:MFS transporter [Comamonas sp. J-3]|jgi:MFS family permease|uniref:MFS transporter n=1 Tax=Comamonas trifloxystrobinivorans TaxID=3350256 RepID=UPI00372BF0CD